MAIRTSLPDVQVAVFAVLDGDSALKALAPVLDHVPAEQKFPWVLLSDFRETRDDTTGEQGRSILIGIDAWSEVEGYMELEDIAEQVIKLLNVDNIAIGNGWQMDYCTYMGGLLDRETDGLTRHGRFEFQMVVHR